MSTHRFAFPRPELGDKFHRFNLNGQYEEAQVLSVMGPETEPDVWKASMATTNGFEFVTSDREHRGQFDWVPHAWQYDGERRGWVPPDVLVQTLSIPGPALDEHYMTWRKRAYAECPQLKSRVDGAALMTAAWEARPLHQTAAAS